MSIIQSLVQSGRSKRVKVDGLLSQNGRPWVKSGRPFEWIEVSKWTVQKCQGGRSESVKLDGPKVAKWPVQKYFELWVHLNCNLPLSPLIQPYTYPNFTLTLNAPLSWNLGPRLVWHRGSTMSHVTYMVLLGLSMEYLGPSMTAPPSHVT